MTLDRKQAGPTTVIHGSGELGGKGEGLLLMDQIDLQRAHKLKTHIITSGFYERYRDAGCINKEDEERLRQIHASFSRTPIGVRASEQYENDPTRATSGISSSYMLPNKHRDLNQRFSQFLHALRLIYDKFAARPLAPGESESALSVLVNPIPGVSSDTRAGKLFYPMSSGVADSVFKYPLTVEDGPQDPTEGFARVAFGHGYGVVLDAFEVIPMATVSNPLNPALMGNQRYFYGIPLVDEPTLNDDEMSTLSLLNMSFANPKHTRHFQDERNRVNFERLFMDDSLNYRGDLEATMERLHKIDSDFQIEFTWNVVEGKGALHIVQFKRLRSADFSRIDIPAFNRQSLIATDQFQGHGVVEGIRHAVVINPFAYNDSYYDHVLERLATLNQEMKERGERYILVCPGRLGTKNRDWGFNVPFTSISSSAAVVEYGFDIKGSSSIAVTSDEMTGGIYGSHFLYQILGGASAAENARRARMFGSQGSHFLTNLYTTGTLYLFVNPAEDHLSPWFFSPPEGEITEPVYVKRFDQPVTAYADIFQRRCLVAPASRTAIGAPQGRRPGRMIRVINPHKIQKAFIFAMNPQIREAARRLDRRLPHCELTFISDPADCNSKLADKTFVLFVDEGAMPFHDRQEFKRKNPFGVSALLTYDTQVGCAPTQEEAERIYPLCRDADLVFHVNDTDCKPVDVMPAVMRHAEDLHNLEYHKRARRCIFLVVDDELRWFSQFLPVLYRIIGQRAGVMMARTYEEAREILDQHGSDVVCLITDMLFPMGGKITADAGRRLVLSTKKKWPRIPIIVASKMAKAEELQRSALILPKGDPGYVEILDQYVHDFTGIGDFLFVHEGKMWRCAKTLAELGQAIADAPVELLDEYAEKDYFSTWLYMHGFRDLADRLVVRQDRGEELRDVLTSNLERELVKVERLELVLQNRDKEVVGRARTVDELVELVARVDLRTLKEYSKKDHFSMWLMRKGHPEVADRVRPIHGAGEELREEILAALRGTDV